MPKSMNNNLESWHSFYNNKQRQRDAERTELTFHRRFKKLLWDAFDSSNLLEVSKITVALTNYIYLEATSQDSMVAIQLIPESETLKTKYLNKNESVDFGDADELELDEGIYAIREMLQAICER